MSNTSNKPERLTLLAQRLERLKARHTIDLPYRAVCAHSANAVLVAANGRKSWINNDLVEFLPGNVMRIPGSAKFRWWGRPHEAGQ